MRTLARYLLTQNAAILALTIIAEVCLPLTLELSAPDVWMALFVLTTIVGVLGGFALQYPKWKNPRTAVIWLIAGLLFLFVHTGEIGGAVWASAQATLRLLPILLLSSENMATHVQSLSAWIGPQQQLISEVFSFSERTSVWLASLLQGFGYADPAARAFCIGLGLWLLATCASWRIAREKDALGGLLPTTLALALALNFIAPNRWAVWLHLAAFLLLLAVLRLASLTSSWEAQHTDFSESVAIDSLTGAMPVIMLIVSISFAAYTFSMKDLIDRLRERQKPPASSVVGSSGGPTPGSRLTPPRPEADLLGTHQILAGPHLPHDVLMYISTGDLPPIQHAVELQAPHYYWRRINYQYYTGSGWSNPTAIEEQSPPKAMLIPSSPTDYRHVHATVTFPGGTESRIYWTGALVSSEQPLGVLWRARPGSSQETSDGDPFNGADMIGAFIDQDEPTPVESYTFDALLPQAGEAALRAAPVTYPAWVSQKYLQLPEALPVRVRALARNLTASQRTPYDRAIAIEAYLRKFPYSVEVPAPPPGRDATDFFLFSLKKGYCDYYATAMAILARSAGLPARIVIGYASGSYDPYTAQYNVTQADAHTWTEIYFTGIGWIEFEPTAGQPAPARETNHPQPEVTEGDTAFEKLANALPVMSDSSMRLAWFMLALPVVMWLAWLAGDHWRLSHMDPAETTARLYRRLRRSTSGMAGAGPIGQTALEYSSSLAGSLAHMSDSSPFLRAFAAPIPKLVARLTALHMHGLFAPRPLSGADRRQAIQIWSQLRWRLALLNVFLPIRRLLGPGQNAPSILPGSRAG